MECPHCGGKIPDGIDYCNVCSHVVTDAERTGRPQESAGPDPLVTMAPVPAVDPLATNAVPSVADMATRAGGAPEAAPTEMAPQAAGVGDIIVGRFEVIRMLGKGGMGAVYLCRDRQLERQVAIKSLLANLAGQEWSIQRFLVEARAVASINHANVIQVHDVIDDASGNYIVMEYLEGETLAAKLQREGKLDVREVTRIVLQIGMALNVAHKTGVIHRDIKPENIMFTSTGVPKLGDFGIAQLFGQSDLTHTGTAMGTWVYASPEQLVDAKHVDQRSDIYSLGATMYEMLTGEMPRHIHLDKIPSALQPVLKKCLAKAPDDRYQSAAELVKGLADAYNKAQSGGAEEVLPQPATAVAPGVVASVPTQIAPGGQQGGGARRREKVLWHGRGVLWANPAPLLIGVALLTWLLLKSNPPELARQADDWLTKFRIFLVESLDNQAPPLAIAAILWMRTIPYYWLGIALGACLTVLPTLRHITTKFRLSSSRLSVRTGLLFRHEHVLHLDQIQDVHVSQSLPGMLLRYGKISLVCWNSDVIVLEGVPSPSKVGHRITSAMRQHGDE